MAEMLTYILADDDDIYREYTIAQLDVIPGLKCLGVCTNAVDTRAMLQQIQPDLLVLDVEMPSLTGIQLAKSLKQLPLTIFITSHPHYAADAFDIDAVDYMVKPVPLERMLRAIDKVKMLAKIKADAMATETFQQKDDDSFFIKDLYTEVLYAESMGDFVNFYLENGEKKIALVSMKNLELQLPSSAFMRISRTSFVNIQKITKVENEQVYIGKISLAIGKTYADNVLKTIIGNKAIKRFI
jgi:DNA-binding LytR/AlgR family response regulator